MPLTIRDVAKKLDLSITTVSRALDGYDDVAEQTRELVIKTARKMGYVPNRAARQLRRQKSETMGFIIPSISKRFDEAFFTEFISGLGEELSNQNFDLLIANATTDDGEHSMYKRWVSSRKVDGFILNRLHKQDWRVKYLTEENVPFVALGQSQEDLNYPCIRVDGAEAYFNLVQHIKSRGFSRFAFLGGPKDLMDHVERLNWCKSALKKSGLEIERANIISTDMSSTAGYEATRRLFARSTPPDAILCVADEIAFGALHAAHEQGIRIGSEIAVGGFDGVQDAKHSEPPLTTLDLPVFDIARQLVDMLLKTIAGTRPDSPVFIKPSLLIRPSTGR
ncbi:MAG TPA: LacI family DNA-binding transcriptional regulator [Anaerolineales bacterium]|nr:LacI family DNA-binding transcriptional regulator [Anaerolineales bacterium]